MSEKLKPCPFCGKTDPVGVFLHSQIVCLDDLYDDLYDEDYFKEKHGVTFSCLSEMGVALADEVCEVADAIERNDIDGEHGVKRELAQVAAVCLKALEGLE